MQINDKIVKKIKKDFPIFENNPGLIYLDNAATSQKPLQVIDSITSFYKKENANIHRGFYKLSENATKRYEDSRLIIEKFINAEHGEVIFTKNTTESINLLSYCITPLIKEGRNEILLTEMEHHSNLVPWQEFAKRHNFKIKFIKIKEDFNLDYDDANKEIGEKTALISMVHVSNSLGIVNDVKKLVEIGKRSGAITIVDAAQSVSHMKIDVKEIGCDFLAFSGHKMLAPFGIGVLYGKKELLEKMIPFNFGGDMIKSVSYENATYNDLPMKFEAGTQNIAGVIGLAEAIKYLEYIGMENIKRWEKELLVYSVNKIRNIKGIKLYLSNVDLNSSIFSFNLNNAHPHDVVTLLDEDGIAIRGGHHCCMPLMNKLGISGTCRISFSFYNNFEDIDKLINSLNKINQIFNR